MHNCSSHIAQLFRLTYISAMSEPRRITDPETLKGLAQPIRLKLYQALLVHGPATAGMLTTRVGGDPGQISYHLRELAKRGFIEEAPELIRDMRQRWWRTALGSHSWSFLDFNTSEGRIIADTVKAQWTVEQFQAVRDHERRKTTLSQPWQEASTASQSFLYLSPAELSELNDEVNEVLQRWSMRSKANRTAADGDIDCAPVRFFHHSFPEES